MNCAETRGQLMAYLDSELDAATTAEVGRHLDACPACRARFEAEERLERGLVAALGDETLPAAEWERLTRSLVPPATSWWRRAAAAAALAAAIVIALRLQPAPDGLLAELQGLHARAAAARPDLSLAGLAGDDERHDAVAAFLAARRLDVLAPRVPGHVDGHAIELVSAREERLLGQPAVSVELTCCDVPVSLILIRRERLDALPTEWQKRLTVGALDGDDEHVRARIGTEVAAAQVWRGDHDAAPLRDLASL